MGEKTQEALKLRSDKRLRVEFQGARITSDAGLLACRELDEALGLTQVVLVYLQEMRDGRNVRHELVPMLRQSVYSDSGGWLIKHGCGWWRNPAVPPFRVDMGNPGGISWGWNWPQCTEVMKTMASGELIGEEFLRS